MTDTKLLREQVDKSGLKYQFIAENLDLSRFGLSMKVDGETEFKVGEIIKLCDLLNIDNDLRDRIFLFHKYKTFCRAWRFFKEGELVRSGIICGTSMRNILRKNVANDSI